MQRCLATSRVLAGFDRPSLCAPARRRDAFIRHPFPKPALTCPPDGRRLAHPPPSRSRRMIAALRRCRAWLALLAVLAVFPAAEAADAPLKSVSTMPTTPPPAWRSGSSAGWRKAWTAAAPGALGVQPGQPFPGVPQRRQRRFRLDRRPRRGTRAQRQPGTYSVARSGPRCWCARIRRSAASPNSRGARWLPPRAPIPTCSCSAACTAWAWTRTTAYRPPAHPTAG